MSMFKPRREGLVIVMGHDPQVDETIEVLMLLREWNHAA